MTFNCQANKYGTLTLTGVAGINTQLICKITLIDRDESLTFGGEITPSRFIIVMMGKALLNE